MLILFFFCRVSNNAISLLIYLFQTDIFIRFVWVVLMFGVVLILLKEILFKVVMNRKKEKD